jgi:hypothetical protein
MLVVPVLAALIGVVPPLFPVDLPENEDDEHVRETVAALTASPLDINEVGVDELLAIPWLDPVLAWRIVRHRDSVGGFRTLGELRLVPGMTAEWVRLVAPCLQVGPGPTPVRTAARLTLRSDTIPPAGDRLAGSVAVALDRGPWSAALAAENDAGEPVLPDWLGGSVAYRAGETQACAGDFTFGTGLGLVFSGPHRRFADRTGRNPGGPSTLRALRLPLETRALRGLAAERAFGRFTLAGFAAWTGRDAVLGSDGNVRRIRLDGRNDDSSRLAGRRAVDERAAGARAGINWGAARLGLSFGRVDYSPGIAPVESLWSFHGRSLVFGGVGYDWLGRPFRAAVELAGSSGGGGAGAAAVEGNWDRFRLALGADLRQAGFYAPLGRWQSTTGRRDRFSARASVRWTPGALAVSASASSYQDFLVDSLPGRVALDIGMPLGPVRLTLGVERRYRLDEPRFRRAHAELRWQPAGPLGLAIEFDDGHAEASPGRGRSVALRAETGLRALSFKAAAARFDIAGGARMYHGEPVVYGPARSYSTAATGWRLSGAAGVRLGFGRIGLSAGWTPSARSGWEAALRVEAGSG